MLCCGSVQVDFTVNVQGLFIGTGAADWHSDTWNNYEDDQMNDATPQQNNDITKTKQSAWQSHAYLKGHIVYQT